MQDDEDTNAQSADSRVAQIEDVLAEFDGDYRAAISALLHDIDTLARDYESSVSPGFKRGGVPKAPAVRFLRR